MHDIPYLSILLSRNHICACSVNLVMVKISLMERGAVVAKRRTKCVRRENAAALFEEKFIFSIQPKSLFSDESSCLIQLFSRTRIGLHILSILISNSSFRLSFDHFFRYQKMSWKNEFSTAWHDLARYSASTRLLHHSLVSINVNRGQDFKRIR